MIDHVHDCLVLPFSEVFEPKDLLESFGEAFFIELCWNIKLIFLILDLSRILGVIVQVEVDA